ncbi:co(2)-response secreted protease [Phtheirospermum japonicum]|uniref:Co(2)-response secreted protease n=1 Tax=Phtheirospermum japonicum TaxID=374723 RepID=A0A830CRR3_9LAMI|nr:co(2)-response secreted protease [Phtheirospermum japonicum]
MGASPIGAPTNYHAQLMSELMKRKKNLVVHTYNKSFVGFAARLSEEEAKSIARRPGVVSVFPDRVLQLQTTRSWDFLMSQQTFKNIDLTPTRSHSQVSWSTGADTIIGIMDTGIWPEHPSFNDMYMGPIPKRWKGKCMPGKNFNSSTCNRKQFAIIYRKVIGSRYYGVMDTARDLDGHGTHVASTAAGKPIFGASYYGLAKGTARGCSPGSRIAAYRVCGDDGECQGSDILRAYDDAIADGVDVISISVGEPPQDQDIITDPVAIGAFHAAEKGIIVVGAAGNDGPFPMSVANVAPWILTVAATTIDRDFEADIVLGDGEVIKGGGINFSGLNKSAVYHLVDGRSASSNQTYVTDASYRDCIPGSLIDGKVKNGIVVCENNDGHYGLKEKYMSLVKQGAIGMIVMDNNFRQVPLIYGTFPIAAVTEGDGAQIRAYINSTSKPLATILPTVTIPNYKPAPVVPYFSSRGPAYGIETLIKPDIAAPGVGILAACPLNDTSVAIPGKEPPFFYIRSGTSQACPHVSGLAAIVKSLHPKWSPSAIRSAIMTTAIQRNNLHAPIKVNNGLRATPYDIGAGEISIFGPLRPGLVYETTTTDYVQFLCYMGYNASVIKSIGSTVPNKFSCPSNSSPDLISNMNYPSIAISGLKTNGSRTVKRTVTNVGEVYSTYTASVEAPPGMQVQVVPDKLQFTKNVNKKSFQVTFIVSTTSKEPLFGSITWSNWKYNVQSPFVVSNA